MPSASFHDAGGITVFGEFVKREYETYILIDFAESTDEVPNLFTDVPNLDFIFMNLKYFFTKISLYVVALQTTVKQRAFYRLLQRVLSTIASLKNNCFLYFFIRLIHNSL